MIAEALSQTQKILHSNGSVALPGSLLAIAGVMVVYRHMTHTRDGTTFDSESDPLRTFLALIVVQMLPIVLIEMKIMLCKDPVDLLCKFGTKVLLMHACFLGLRTATMPFEQVGMGSCNVLGLVGVLVALHFGFTHRWTPHSFWEHRDVWCLMALASIAAVLTVQIDEWLKPKFTMPYTSFGTYYTRQNPVLKMTISTASDYIELLAFVPAVWSVYRSAKVPESPEVDEADKQRRALSFFAFLVAFYVTEDLVNAVSLAPVLPLAAGGHVIHFLLLLDFTGFLLSHVYNPQKLQDSIRRWCPDAYLV